MQTTVESHPIVCDPKIGNERAIAGMGAELELLNVDKLSVRVQGTVNTDLLAFKFFHFGLVINIISTAAGVFLQHILVT